MLSEIKKEKKRKRKFANEIFHLQYKTRNIKFANRVLNDFLIY